MTTHSCDRGGGCACAVADARKISDQGKFADVVVPSITDNAASDATAEAVAVILSIC